MDDNYIKEITGFNADLREKLINYYINLPENFEIFIMNQHRIFIRKLKKYYAEDKKGEFYYATFLKTIEMINDIENNPYKKGNLSKKESDILDVLTMNRVLLKNKLKGKKIKKKKPLKRELVLQYHSTILKLRHEKFSWENVSVYLEMYNNVKISKNYLWRFFRDNGDDIK